MLDTGSDLGSKQLQLPGSSVVEEDATCNGELVRQGWLLIDIRYPLSLGGTDVG